jgi:hypothetical protein
MVQKSPRQSCHCQETFIPKAKIEFSAELYKFPQIELIGLDTFKLR